MSYMYHVLNVLIYSYINIIEDTAKIFEFFYSVEKGTAIRIVDKFLWFNGHVSSVGRKTKKQIWKLKKENWKEKWICRNLEFLS